MFSFGFLKRTHFRAVFTDRTGLELSTVYTSNKIKITEAGALTITGGEFSVNGGAWGTTGTSSVDDIVQLRATSSASGDTTTDVVLSVDAVPYDTWSLTTKLQDFIVDGADYIVDGSDYIVDGA